MRTAYLAGAGNTPFGRLDGRDALDLMAEAARRALADAALARAEVDGVLCGYATTLPHLMLASLFCERFSLNPAYAHAMQLGGATGGAMLMLARELVRAGRCQNVLVVAGENRLSGQARDAAMQTLAQVGDPEFEVPTGASVPAYYALLASRYMHETGITEADLSGHLNNANGKTKAARAKASALMADDNQLYEAVALLKGLNILGMRDKKPEPATNGES